MAGLFDKIKKDVKKGIEEGIAVVKEGASVVSVKMGELTAEGKRQYKMYDLKAKIQGQMTVLGGRVYDVLNSKKSPSTDSRVKLVFDKIKALEEQLAKLEKGKEKKIAAPRKTPPKGKVPSKKTGKSVKKSAAGSAPTSAVKKQEATRG